MNEPAELDLRGLKCPLPALRTDKRLATLPAGAQLKVLATDPMSQIDIPHLVQTRGDTLVTHSKDATDTGVVYCFVIARCGIAPTPNTEG